MSEGHGQGQAADASIDAVDGEAAHRAELKRFAAPEFLRGELAKLDVGVQNAWAKAERLRSHADAAALGADDLERQRAALAEQLVVAEAEAGVG